MTNITGSDLQTIGSLRRTLGISVDAATLEQCGIRPDVRLNGVAYFNAAKADSIRRALIKVAASAPALPKSARSARPTTGPPGDGC